ncbi:MAG: antibiotic transporter ATP-binding protein, partial [Nocardioidaceae bacterium]|nr:antibiotic transporter ATP-binding protein [Nocardioidaceae bacterium]
VVAASHDRTFLDRVCTHLVDLDPPGLGTDGHGGSPDLLLLDEPTNHLSPTLVTELTEALTTAAGTVVVASHDLWLRRCWPGPEVRLSPYAP